MTPPTLKPWPLDELVLLAALAGEEVRSAMQGVYPAACRDCGRELRASTRTVGRAIAWPARMGRPLVFLCRVCVAGYARPACMLVRDDRPQPQREEAP